MVVASNGVALVPCKCTLQLQWCAAIFDGPLTSQVSQRKRHTQPYLCPGLLFPLFARTTRRLGPEQSSQCTLLPPGESHRFSHPMRFKCQADLRRSPRRFLLVVPVALSSSTFDCQRRSPALVSSGACVPTSPPDQIFIAIPFLPAQPLESASDC